MPHHMCCSVRDEEESPSAKDTAAVSGTPASQQSTDQ
eukprot:CAMPEP_0174296558 /NCGR_PEP_ID=MMETSP0809-20121228/48241_1 /TAXON_ID=73025 ORGANISM="Eutreptiella gymnastica-like, Strain CCMP1594" /NCGR_SAMPLE_ID=MMETSP0809 /ASSEMBLY_ACC=CAM_ASM_000658 /LENGTH=36 /DNA_ID= /DNA_START= /DNA_END= /DNA_ORIENTATION=